MTTNTRRAGSGAGADNSDAAWHRAGSSRGRAERGGRWATRARQATTQGDGQRERGQACLRRHQSVAARRPCRQLWSRAAGGGHALLLLRHARHHGRCARRSEARKRARGSGPCAEHTNSHDDGEEDRSGGDGGRGSAVTVGSDASTTSGGGRVETMMTPDTRAQ